MLKCATKDRPRVALRGRSVTSCRGMLGAVERRPILRYSRCVSGKGRYRPSVSYTLLEHGDAVEQKYWELFLRDEFPSYETFWASAIVPLTLRPESIAFLSDAGLAKIGRGPEEVCNAQLHYTTFTHLVRVFDLRQDGLSLADTFVEALVRLAAATDVADELLERGTNPGSYTPWDEASGRRARDAWRNAHGTPTWDLRKYRNRLLHGGLVPFAMQGTVIEGGVLVPREKPVLRFPKIGREGARAITSTGVGSSARTRSRSH